MRLETNELELTPAELHQTADVGERLSAESMSLYLTSGGLYAFVIDSGGGQHLGVRIAERDTEAVTS